MCLTYFFKLLEVLATSNERLRPALESMAWLYRFNSIRLFHPELQCSGLHRSREPTNRDPNKYSPLEPSGVFYRLIQPGTRFAQWTPSAVNTAIEVLETAATFKGILHRHLLPKDLRFYERPGRPSQDSFEVASKVVMCVAPNPS